MHIYLLSILLDILYNIFTLSPYNILFMFSFVIWLMCVATIEATQVWFSAFIVGIKR